MRITDYYIRKLAPSTRRELFLYIPRVTLVGMEEKRFLAIMELYDASPLAERVLEEMQAGPGRGRPRVAASNI